MSEEPAYASTETRIEEELDGTLVRYTYFDPVMPTLGRLLDAVFEEHWDRVVVGPWIEGAVFEVCFAEKPKLSTHDGYLTVDLGRWHFHLCLGPHRGTSSSELREKRPAAQAAFFERRGKGCAGGRSRGVRVWNGFGEQMTTVWFPNAYLTDDMQLLPKPDWERLALNYDLRSRFLGETIPASYEAAANEPWDR